MENRGLSGWRRVTVAVRICAGMMSCADVRCAAIIGKEMWGLRRVPDEHDRCFVKGGDNRPRHYPLRSLCGVSDEVGGPVELLDGGVGLAQFLGETVNLFAEVGDVDGAYDADFG